MSWTTEVRLLARRSAWRRWATASLLARLPGSMTLLALVLAGQQVTGSVAAGAQLAGVATATAGVTALWRGRRLDRHELRGGLRRDCLLTAGALGAQAAAVAAAAPFPVLIGLAVVQGVAGAALFGGFRALLPSVVPDQELPRANALDAVFVEVAFVGGPALAGLLGLVTGAAGVLAVMAGAQLAAAAVTSRLPPYAPEPPAGAVSPLRIPAARIVYALGLMLGLCVGAFESTVPARLTELGLPSAAAGPLLALMAIGSAAGGLVAAARAGREGDPRREAAILLAGLGLLLVPAGLVDSTLLLGAALLVAGGPIAPLNALGALLLSRRVPAGRQAEGFAVYTAAILIGAGLGQVMTGRLLGPLGARALFLLAAAVPLLLAAVLTLAGYRTRGSAAA